MTLMQDILAGNRDYLEKQWDPADAELPSAPSKRLAVLACMDCRYDVEQVLGLRHGDAKIIRNAGNHLDDGAVRSLTVAIHALGVRRIVILGHSDCGMTTLDNPDKPVHASVLRSTEVPEETVESDEFMQWLGPFSDPTVQVQRVMAACLQHPLVPPGTEVYGLLYDNQTGKVSQVEPVAPTQV